MTDKLFKCSLILVPILLKNTDQFEKFLNVTVTAILLFFHTQTRET